MAAVDPAWRHYYARDSYSNCGGGERDMVLTLTPEHLAIGNGFILDGLNQACAEGRSAQRGAAAPSQSGLTDALPWRFGTLDYRCGQCKPCTFEEKTRLRAGGQWFPADAGVRKCNPKSP
jgi:hypothetical protein